MTYPKKGIQDSGFLVELETRDLAHGTRDPGPFRWDPGHYFIWDLRPEIGDTGRGIWDTCDRSEQTENKHLLSHLGRKNYDSNGLNQMSYTVFPRK